MPFMLIENVHVSSCSIQDCLLSFSIYVKCNWGEQINIPSLLSFPLLLIKGNCLLIKLSKLKNHYRTTVRNAFKELKGEFVHMPTSACTCNVLKVQTIAS